MKKFISIAGLIFCMSAVSANAKTDITEYKMNINTGLLTVSGKTDIPNGMVSINIPMHGKSSGQLQEETLSIDSLLYCKQVVSDENGEFSFTAEFSTGDTEGIYEVFVGDENTDVAEKFSVSYVTYDNYAAAAEALNAAAKKSQTEFRKVLAENEWKLFICSDYEIENKDVIEDILYNFAKENGFSTTDSEFNMSVYKKALAAQMIADKNFEGITKLLEEFC